MFVFGGVVGGGEVCMKIFGVIVFIGLFCLVLIIVFGVVWMWYESCVLFV